MNEKKLIQEIKKACNNIMGRVNIEEYNDETFDHLSFEFHLEEGYTPYLEFYGIKSIDASKDLLNHLCQVICSICTQNGIVFIYSP